MTLYTLRGSYPTTLPNRISLSNGMTRTDSSTFTLDEIADAGYTEVSDPPSFSFPDVLEWTGTEWLVRGPNDNEIALKWQQIKDRCVQLLEATDYKIIKSVETGLPVDPVVISYRQTLRDIYNNVGDLNPWNIEWPQLPNSISQ